MQAFAGMQKFCNSHRLTLAMFMNMLYNDRMKYIMR